MFGLMLDRSATREPNPFGVNTPSFVRNFSQSRGNFSGLLFAAPKKMKNKKTDATNYDEFNLGQGYGSGQKGSDARKKRSLKQYGDNPLPKSGGGYAKAEPKQRRVVRVDRSTPARKSP